MAHSCMVLGASIKRPPPTSHARQKEVATEGDASTGVVSIGSAWIRAGKGSLQRENDMPGSTSGIVS